MQSGTDVLHQYAAAVRWRVRSLAAGLDRVQRHAGRDALISTDPRLTNLRAGGSCSPTRPAEPNACN
ncbi:MAG: hypothetical protein ACTHM6_03085 [Tepidisphaeraceae bacterium]